MITKLLFSCLVFTSCFALEEPNDVTTSSSSLSENGQSAKLESGVTLRGLHIVSDSSIGHLDAKNVQGVKIDEKVNVPSPHALQKKLESWIGQSEINRNTLLAIKGEILSAFAKEDQRMITVEIPEQDVTSGVVEVVVAKAKLGSVKYCGNRWFSKAKVEKKLHLQEGKPLDENQLFNDLAWLNQNPFHYTEAVLSPGVGKGSTNVELVTKDRLPLRVYTGGDNTGIKSTGRARWYGGLTWGNAFFIDDYLSYQFTTNTSFDTYNAHFLNYTSYLPWQHFLMVYGGYARIDPRIETEFEHHNKEAQASLRYKIPFKPLYTSFQQQLYFGFDYKYITSLLFFVSNVDQTLAQNTIVNVTQGMLGYQCEYKPTRHEFTCRVELFGSPAKWLPFQTNADYSALRADAKPRYIYGTLTLGEIYTFCSKESISALFRVQGTPNTLVPSEQFVLGGHNTVRGYEESVFISDNGFVANLEVRSRPLTFFKRVKDELTFLAFMDYGQGYNYHPFDGIKKRATLWGVGPGVRYTINPYLHLRVDYGFKLHHVKFDDLPLGMWHVAGTLSY